MNITCDDTISIFLRGGGGGVWSAVEDHYHIFSIEYTNCVIYFLCSFLLCGFSVEMERHFTALL